MTTMIRLTSPRHIDGEVTTTQDFETLHPIAKLDLLSDWIGVLTELYGQCRQECFPNAYFHEPHELCASALHRKGRS